MLEDVRVQRRVCVCLLHLARPQLSGLSFRRRISITARGLDGISHSLKQRPCQRYSSLSSFPPPSTWSRQIRSHGFASGSILPFAARPNAAISDASAIRWPISLENSLSLNRAAFERRYITWLAQRAWRRSIHNSPVPKEGKEVNRDRERDGASNGTTGKDDLHSSASNKTKPGNTAATASSVTNKNILNRLPHMPQIHRPTKEELLAAATGFWSRQKIRFKWFSIRSLRPFNTDDISAFFSWFLVGHVIWILLGTTTFFSLAILAVNTVFAQGMLSHSLKAY